MQLAQTTQRRPMLESMLPLINVIFLLLIFFMLAGQIARQPSEDLETPTSEAEQAPVQDPPRLALHADGQLTLAEQPVTTDQLADQADDWLNSQQARLHADARVSTAQLRPVLKTLRSAGIDEIQLITRRPQP